MIVTLCDFGKVSGRTAWGVLLMALAAFFPENTKAQVIGQEVRTVPARLHDVSDIENAGKGATDFIVVPLPISNPTLGSGVGLAVGALFSVDAKSRPSFAGVGAAWLDSQSWGVGVALSTYLSADRYRVDASLGLGDVNYDFYGVGSAAGDRGHSILLDQRVWGGSGRILRQVYPNLYVGLQARYYDITTEFSLPRLEDLFPDFKPVSFDLRNAGLGAVVLYDTRKNRFKPREGIMAGIEINYGRTDPGRRSDFSTTYQKGLAYANHYISLSDRSTLALRVSACQAWGDAPFFDICLYGMNSDLRGYSGGQYRDRAMFAVQGEYRRDLTRKLGATVFAGFGSVASGFDAFDSDDLLPSLGVGLRWQVSEAYGANVSVDLAVGRDTSALYFRVGEAF